VATLSPKAGAKVVKFVRFEVGAGIEKKQDDFVSEVMAQVKAQEKAQEKDKGQDGKNGDGTKKH
jgi:hypothetical protein